MLGVQIEGPLHACEWMFTDGLEILIPTLGLCFQEVQESILLYEQALEAKLNLQKIHINSNWPHYYPKMALFKRLQNSVIRGYY